MTNEDLVCMNLTTRSCIIFDYDGTLADTAPAIKECATRVLREYGLSDEQIADAGRLVGPPMPLGFTLVYGIPEDEAKLLGERYRQEFTCLGPDRYPLFEGARELLHSLRRAGKRLAVASSRRHDMLCRMLQEQGVFDLFEAVQGKTELMHDASKTGLVASVLTQMEVCADDAVMIGDRFYDIEGAAAVGVPCAGVLFGTASRQELEQAGAAVIATSIDELADVLLGCS